MNSKLLIFDVGNTLIHSACGVISTSVLADLHALRRNGHTLGVATLRDKTRLADILLQFDFDVLIMMNGGLAEAYGKTVFCAPLDQITRDGIVSRAHDLDIRVSEYGADGRTYAITLHNAAGRFIPTDGYAHCTWEHSKNIDIYAKNGGKRAALAEVCKSTGFARDDVIAFGDGANDIDLLKFAGYAVAMDGAPDELIAAADAVTDTAERDGISLALRKMRLL